MRTTSSTVATATTTEVTTWKLDLSHSSVEFSVRHMVVSSFSGKFNTFDAQILFDESHPESAVVRATVDVASIDTGNEQRESHLLSDDFFNAEQFPTMAFDSTSVERDGRDFKIHGKLTIRDITRPVTFEAEYGGQIQDPWGNVRSGVVAETTINRKDFGLNWNGLIEAGGAVVGDKVKIKLNIEFTRES